MTKIQLCTLSACLLFGVIAGNHAMAESNQNAKNAQTFTFSSEEKKFIGTFGDGVCSVIGDMKKRFDGDKYPALELAIKFFNTPDFVDKCKPKKDLPEIFKAALCRFMIAYTELVKDSEVMVAKGNVDNKKLMEDMNNLEASIRFLQALFALAKE